jgi:hypothetical protein
MLGIVGSLITMLGKGVIDHFRHKQEIKEAVVKNKIRLAGSQQDHNHDWEMKQLENAGWKDDVLFYAIIGMFIWAGFEPEAAGVFFENLEILPEWFVQIFMWLVASIVGVKKVGEYLPGLIKSVKEAVTKK